MARDTDRKRVSEAVRLQSVRPGRAWVIEHLNPHGVTLAKGPSYDEKLVIRYGVKGQIVEAWHNWAGIRNGIITRKREPVLAIIEGKR